jgi:hypothetical protein
MLKTHCAVIGLTSFKRFLSATVQLRASLRWFGASPGWFHVSGRQELFCKIALNLILGDL